MATALFYFALIFPGPFRQRFWLDVVLGTLAGLLFVLTLTKWMVSRVQVVDGYITGDFGPVLLIFTLFFLLELFGSLVVLVLKYRSAKGTTRQQLAYALVAFLFFISTFLNTNLILPVFFGMFQFNNLGPVFSLPMVVLIGYAIIRHQLMDIRVVIQRGLIYTLLLVIIIGFYLLIISGLGYLFQIVTKLTIIMSTSLTIIVGIFGVPVIERYFRRITDPIFFKDKYDYATALHELSEILNKHVNSDAIISESTRKLGKIFKTDLIDVVLTREVTLSPSPGERDEEKITQPIILGETRLGKIILGKKLSGDVYSREDVRLLETFAKQAAVALEKARLYDEVRAYSKELEERVTQRTAEITRLQDEQRQMMVDIAHGLQTPLTVIKMKLGTLKKQAPLQHHLETFEKSLDGVSRFIYDLLNLAKLETQKENFKKDSVDLSVLLRELVEYFEVLAHDLGITISAAIEPNVVLLGDKDTLNELVTNLVSNAFKYMGPRREKRVNIALVRRNGGAELIVEDTGIGIGSEDLPRIFNRFYRIKNPDTALPKGTGLGLAICKKIVERHNGTIEVESELGKGTKFTITFPLKM